MAQRSFGMNRIKEFFALYRMYRKFHSRRYALQRAYEISTGYAPF